MRDTPTPVRVINHCLRNPRVCFPRRRSNSSPPRICHDSRRRRNEIYATRRWIAHARPTDGPAVSGTRGNPCRVPWAPVRHRHGSTPDPHRHRMPLPSPAGNTSITLDMTGRCDITAAARTAAPHRRRLAHCRPPLLEPDRPEWAHICGGVAIKRMAGEPRSAKEWNR